jgi:hypothetical protein
VDLLPSKDGTVFVLEVNGIPGGRGLQQATGIDVAGAVIDHLVRKVAAPDEARLSGSLSPDPSKSRRAGGVVSAAGLPG